MTKSRAPGAVSSTPSRWDAGPSIAGSTPRWLALLAVALGLLTTYDATAAPPEKRACPAAAGAIQRFHLILREHLDAQDKALNRSTRLVEELGMDELDRLELLMAIEEEFEVEAKDDAIDRIATLGELDELVTALVCAPPPSNPQRG